MPGLSDSLATRLLTEFLAVMSSFPDEASATRAAVDRATVALEAEVGAVLQGHAVTSVGFAANRQPEAALRALATAPDAGLELPGVGHCHVVVGAFDDQPSGHLLLARAAEKFSVEEVNLVRAMARMLSVTLAMMRTIGAERELRARSEQQAAENQRLLRSLQERQRLMEAFSAIESSISRRSPLSEILDEITAQARRLLESDAAVLRLIDSDEPSDLLLASADGFSPGQRSELWRLSRGAAPASTTALAECVVVPLGREPGGSQGSVRAGRELPDTLATGIAAAVHESGTPIGSLMVASADPARVYGAAEHAALLAFAEHVSLALTDARTVEEMRKAFHDPLTGLASRALFLDRLEHQLAAVRQSAEIGLLFIDLDRFKPVNDTLGHEAGDQLLIEVAARIKECIRSVDTVARFGGDEFAVLLCGVDLEAAVAAAERIGESIRAPFEMLGKQTFINASIGVTTGIRGDEDAAELLRNADVAMYYAKRQGEGHCEIYRPQMHTALMAGLQMENDLQMALTNGELVLVHHPIVDLGSGAVAGFEAQIRWRHPGHGLVSAEEFLPLAEKTGQLVQIGAWMLEQACRQAAIWQTPAGSRSSVAVHVGLSARQLRQPDLVEVVALALRDSGLAPERLVLRITETSIEAEAEAESAIEQLAELVKLGTRVLVDHFGDGEFSLSRLRSLPADLLKLGESFAQGLGDPRGAALTRTIVQLAEVLGLETIAGDLESVGQLGQARDAGCRYGQGPVYGPPMDVGQVAAVLRGGRALGPREASNQESA